MSTSLTDAELIDLGAEEALKRCFTALTGKVVSYDPATRTAMIQPLTQRAIEREDGSLALEDLPQLPDVPVIFPMAGPFSITFPIEPGTTGLVLVLSDSDHQWRTSGASLPSEPGDLRRFHLSCARFLPGYAPDDVANPAASTAALVVKGTDVRLGDETASDFVALASLIDSNLAAIATSIGQAVKSDLSAVATYTPTAVAATLVKAK